MQQASTFNNHIYVKTMILHLNFKIQISHTHTANSLAVGKKNQTNKKTTYISYHQVKGRTGTNGAARIRR